MQNERHPAPRQYLGVMISSTFTDMEQHRKSLIEAINSLSFHEIAMENDSAKLVDVIESSLQMVRDGSAYIGVISHKYGQIPLCPERNPNQLSITELEFNEAQQLNRPILLFIMGEDHPVRKADIETDLIRLEKLNTFRERAKNINSDSQVHRVYTTFNCLEDFAKKALQSIAELRRYLDEQGFVSAKEKVTPQTQVYTLPPLDPVPTAPDFYAVTPYIGSHRFVGRQAQLDTLSDWANPSDSHPVLLFEAIGGTGKSILTWEWCTKHSQEVRNDWAGRFWYSFYEKGATMLDFCRRALAYMTSQPTARFKEMNTFELSEVLIHQLQANSWLLILDGLERVLVSYHRFDAAQFQDEEAGTSDKIAHRDPCAAINPEDDDLLRAVAGAGPSKLLLTSRLIPKVLLNKSNQPIPGVIRERLPGMRPNDAEFLIRACGIRGTSLNIQNYLKYHCDCHPLVIGVLAGIINDYLPDRGNFDTWNEDPFGGGQLNFAKLDLVQKRNHILNTALAKLPEPSRQLLSTLALLSKSIDYPTLCALNPKLPPIPIEVKHPKAPNLKKVPEEYKAKNLEFYRSALQRREEYEQTLAQREKEIYAASPEMAATVRDLEHRGLLQYDTVIKRYDLHPVVRGIAVGGLKNEEKNRFGQRLVDHFTHRAQDPYENANSLEDFDNARHIVTVLFQLGKMVDACKFIFETTFIKQLNIRFEAHNEILTIIRPFFSNGWKEMPAYLGKDGIRLARRAAVALRRIGALSDSLDISVTVLRTILKQENTTGLFTALLYTANAVGEQNRLAKENCLLNLASDVASADNIVNDLVTLKLARFRQLTRLGRMAEALTVWSQLQDYILPIETRAIAAHHYVVHLYMCNTLTESELQKAEQLSHSVHSALGIRNLCALRGTWRLEQKDFATAIKSLTDAVALAHKAGKTDRRSEIRLATAKLNLKELSEPNQLAEQFSYALEENCLQALADLWFAIGNNAQAKKYALAAVEWAWADGEPFVHRYDLDKACVLLKKLGVEIPNLQNYDPSKDIKFLWEDKLALKINGLHVKANANQAQQR